MDEEKRVDESWKESVAKEKEGRETPTLDGKGEQEPENIEINFLTYVTSLSMQALIFLGEIPHPTTNQTEKNVPQAKLIIDTLLLIKEKTTGNLNKQEEDLLNSALYQLEMKYVDNTKPAKDTP